MTDSRIFRQRALDGFHLFLVLAFAGVVIAPFLQPGYFWGAHDARHDVYFIQQYDKSVQDGIWFARWGPDWAFGYGYPFWIVYGPLATFLGELFHHFAGLDFEASVKAVLALSVILSGLAMYGFARSWLGRGAGLVAAVAYMTIPYHLVDIFVRAAMAESVALAFLPLALWGFREAVTRPRLAAVMGAGIAYALIMWTSNLVALVFTPALAAYVLVLVWWRWRDGRQTKDKRPLIAIIRSLLAPGLAFVLGLGLSAAFFVPALVEQAYINRTQWFGEYYDPTQHFVYFHQLFDPSWGFGISQPGPDDAAQGGMSYQLGAAATLLSLVTLAVSRRFALPIRREAWFWGLWAVVSVFLMLPVSAPAWRYVPIVPYAQFPWRYLMLAIIPLSVLPGMLVADGGWRMADGRWRMADGRWRMADGRWQMADGRWQMADGRWQMADGRWRMADGGWQMADGGWQMADGGWRIVRGRENWSALLLSSLLFLSSVPYLRVEVREPTPEQGPVSMAALMRFQRTSDEMTGVTAWVDPERRPMWSDMAELWVQGKEVTTRVDYSRVPQNETLAVNSEDVGSAHEQIYFYTREAGQTVTFNRFWYPGWTAWLLDGKDGRPVRKLEVLREDGPLARVVVALPAGEGYVLLRFEDTPLRATAKWITLVTAAGLILTLAIRAGLRTGIGRTPSSRGG